MISALWVSAIVSTAVLLFLPGGLTWLLLPRLGHILLPDTVSLPKWAVVLATALALPIYTLLRVLIQEFSQRRKAMVNAAQLAPLVQDSTVIGIQNVVELLASLANGYPGVSESSPWLTC